MSKMDNLVIGLVYFCTFFTSFLIAHEHEHRPYRPDTNPDMDLMPLTRFRTSYTTSRPLTTGIRDPILLPVPRNSEDESYEYYHYNDDQVGDFTVGSSGYIHSTESNVHELAEEEYVYTTADVSNARKDHLINVASERHSWCWLSILMTFLLLKFL
ncbi:uncharacterized protein TNCT_278771 [Trichonephila clavata]|uniref:Uncharacterized protein n=1 Tax=Trichonephila clavata TaxID=2740835 RepID=A0A8X6FEG9_TRICU|nr:uncharacterized protein TNCT_278771 [Trichonephila clavata]